VIGSTQLVQTLIGHDLVDELRLMIDPLLLGGGKRVFPEDGISRSLRLADSRVATTGSSPRSSRSCGDSPYRASPADVSSVAVASKLRVTGAEMENMALNLRTFFRLLSSWVHGEKSWSRSRLSDFSLPAYS